MAIFPPLWDLQFTSITCLVECVALKARAFARLWLVGLGTGVTSLKMVLSNSFNEELHKLKVFMY